MNHGYYYGPQHGMSSIDFQLQSSIVFEKEICRLQEAMLHGGPSFAQRIGRQIYRGSTGEPPKIEDFS